MEVSLYVHIYILKLALNRSCNWLHIYVFFLFIPRNTRLTNHNRRQHHHHHHIIIIDQDVGCIIQSRWYHAPSVIADIFRESVHTWVTFHVIMSLY